MTRWISSALCTMTLVAVLFCLPVWGIRSTTAVSNVSNTVMSEVHIVKRVPKKAPPAVQKTVQPKKVPIIPAPSAEPVPVPEPEPAEVPDEPAEISTEEPSDDTSASDTGESESNNTAAVVGAEDSFSHMQDAKAVATYKSYALGRIASKKTYPYAARSKGLEGKVSTYTHCHQS